MIRIYHPTNRNNNRIKEIDFLRGFLILLMVMDHLFFDFGQLIYIISNFSKYFKNPLQPSTISL